MKKFTEFMENKQFLKDLEQTLKKVPKSHQDLIKGYQFKPEPDNTLDGDDGHVGEIDEKKKCIRVAAPWNYSREMVFLHELAHAVYKYKMTPELKREWQVVEKKNKNRIKQDREENFCMAYANHYAKHKNKTHDCKDWEAFIEKIPK